MNAEMEAVERLERELRDMPAWDRIRAVREFRATVLVFQTNADELQEFLVASEAPTVAQEMFEVDKRADVYAFQQELMRLVHNVVAAAHTLVDHARVFFRERYSSAGSFPEYETEIVARFSSNGLARFVKDLRNLMMHQRLPSVTSTLSWSREAASTSHRQFWQRSELLKFSRWSAEAKTFLESGPEKIDIGKIVGDYSKAVADFYDWMFDRLKRIHEPDERDVAAKQEELRRAVRSLEDAVLGHSAKR